jgi:hypothetical protein
MRKLNPARIPQGVHPITSQSETYMSKKIAGIIVEVLERAGVKRCYDIVGDTLNLFAEAASRHCAQVVLIHCPRCSTSVERQWPRRSDSRFM